MRHTVILPLEGCENTRDLGGIQTIDGKHVKYKRLLRSGKLSDLSTGDVDLLCGEYSLRRVIDFRASNEKQMQPNVRMCGVENIELPVFDESVDGITHEKRASVVPSGKDLKSAVPDPEQMRQAYGRMVSEEYSISQFRSFFRLLLENKEGSVLWHCSMGKDRAGMAAALVLSALGVSRELIKRDYLLTNELCKDRIHRIVNMVLSNLGDKVDEETCLRAFSAREEYLDFAFELIDNRYGGIDNFIEQQLRLTPDARQKLKEMYLEV